MNSGHWRAKELHLLKFRRMGIAGLGKTLANMVDLRRSVNGSFTRLSKSACRMNALSRSKLVATRLRSSFGAVNALLERPRVARRAVAGLIVIHTLLLGYSAYVHSPTLNEPGHLVAGLSHWKFRRFDLYPVNPPLVSMVAALPLLAVEHNEDWNDYYEGPGLVSGIHIMGANFVVANGNRSYLLFMIARWACIPFSWIGAVTCYLWARDLYGRPAGVLASLIWCFEPNMVAHASLITPDAHAAALGLAACYAFWCWLRRPTWFHVLLTGVVLGLAELCKTTLVLFYIIWPLTWAIYRWPDRRIFAVSRWLREAAMLLVVMGIGLYVLNLGYAFEGSFTRLKDLQFVSDLFSGPQQTAPYSTNANRFAASWIGYLKVPLPKNYLLGIDLQQGDFENWGRPAYLGGQWRDHGWWYYYIYASAIKVPLGLWAIGLCALLGRLRFSHIAPCIGFARGKANRIHILQFPLGDEFVLLFPAFIIFATVSSKTGLNEHLRYILPVFPFCFVFTSQIIRLLPLERKIKVNLTSGGVICYGWGGLTWNKASDSRPAQILGPLDRRMTLACTIGVVSLCTWFITSSAWIYPHSLSYFNESIAGPIHGPEHLLFSNVDWGQDLSYLRDWERDRLGQAPLYVGYDGWAPLSMQRFRDILLLDRSSNSAARPVQNTPGTNTALGASLPAFMQSVLIFYMVRVQ